MERELYTEKMKDLEPGLSFRAGEGCVLLSAVRAGS